MNVPFKWSRSLSTADSIKILCRIGGRILKQAKHHPMVTFLDEYLREGNWQAIISLEHDFQAHIDTLVCVQQVVALFKKCKDLAPLKALRGETLRKFLMDDEACALTNKRFRIINRGDLTGLKPPDIWALFRARDLIQKVLGNVCLGSARLAHGPGAVSGVTTVDGSSPTLYQKMQSQPTCSANLYHLAQPSARGLMGLMPHWQLRAAGVTYYPATITSVYGKALLEEGLTTDTCVIVKGRWGVVPKSATSLRSIVTEPSLNVMVQGHWGRVIADRLRCNAQIDITTGQVLNRRLALQGSVDGSLATLDLSSASDLISIELVKFLLPRSWFEVLNNIRTPDITYAQENEQGHFVTCDRRLHKFSSMGNGFTFPLETLIFWALAGSVVDAPFDRERCVTFGDDIIVPTKHAARVIEVLELCGFRLNKAKSYTTGDFRESCGGDYINGVDIRPVYLNGNLSAEEIYKVHNALSRKGRGRWAMLFTKHLPRHLTYGHGDRISDHLYGPDGYGDGHLISTSYTPTHRRKEVEKGWSGHRFLTFSHRPAGLPGSHDDWVTPLYWQEFSATGETTLTFHGDKPIWPQRGTRGVRRVSIYALAVRS